MNDSHATRKPDAAPSAILPPKELLDLYFLDARHKLLEIAALLDRVARARAAHRGTPRAMDENDYRLAALKRALAAAAGEAPGKAEAIQHIFSDPTREPIESAAGMKGASGAYPG